MTDQPENLSNELIGDLEALQPTPTEAGLVRGGMFAATVAAKIPLIDLARFAFNSPTPQEPQNDPAQMLFQQLLQQVSSGQG
jgi:hypothetical protein